MNNRINIHTAGFQKWLLTQNELPHLPLLLQYWQERYFDIAATALRGGDTEFEKGRAHAYKEVRQTLTDIMTDTEIGTAQADTSDGDGQ